MKRVVLYSRSGPSRNAAQPVAGEPGRARAVPRPPREDANKDAADATAPAAAPRRGWRVERRHERIALAGVIVALLASVTHLALTPPSLPIADDALDAAVRRTLEREVLPSPALRAYQAIAPSVVRVRTFRDEHESDDENAQGVGSGVVIVDDGVILTNLHVVAGARRVRVVFANGLESDAAVIGLQPENDLAVLQAATIPDNLVAATMRSTADLAPGERVVAVGFPFGLGPSVSAGVISGLQREFRAAEGRPALTNLIQFDAAANPGSSGGPLVNSDGEVIGIVTGLLNPTRQGVFVGIGFAVPIENAAAAAGLSPF
jgi:S1-C subfamily serine protease